MVNNHEIDELVRSALEMIKNSSVRMYMIDKPARKEATYLLYNVDVQGTFHRIFEK